MPETQRHMVAHTYLKACIRCTDKQEHKSSSTDRGPRVWAPRQRLHFSLPPHWHCLLHRTWAWGQSDSCEPLASGAFALPGLLRAVLLQRQQVLSPLWHAGGEDGCDLRSCRRQIRCWMMTHLQQSPASAVTIAGRRPAWGGPPCCVDARRGC